MATYTKQPCDIDNRILKILPDTNDGASAYNSVGWAVGADNIQRSILQFDISDLPDGVTINSAKLQLYYAGLEGADPTGKTVWAYKLTRADWEELQSTWNDYKTATPWTAPGGDYVTSDPSGGSDTVPAPNNWMEWDIKAIVEDAILNVSDQVELLVKFENETAGGAGIIYWYSKDEATQVTLRPRLVMDYVPVVAKPYGLVV